MKKGETKSIQRKNKANHYEERTNEITRKKRQAKSQGRKYERK